MPGTRGGRRVAKNKREVRSLQVSPGGGDEVVRELAQPED